MTSGPGRLLTLATTVAAVLAGAVAAPPDPSASARAPRVDEVTFAYGTTSHRVVVSWRGSPRAVFIGRDRSYGTKVLARSSAITPVDIPGPFREAHLKGLAAGTTYHYKIGPSGQDRILRTAPRASDGFTAVALGDTEATTCRSYEAELFSLVASIQADFVIHHGDMALARECGEPSVHQFWLDMEAMLDGGTAFMPTWGNNEHGVPLSVAPPGTPLETLANYKGRVAVPHPHIVPSDGPKRIRHPGCGAETGSASNTCRGEDWGWFRAGGVLFISYPEPDRGSIASWQPIATRLMSRAQGDATIDFIVTYGHRPLVASSGYHPPAHWDQVFGDVAATYGVAARPSGKWVLSLSGHRHNLEVLSASGGVTAVVNGGGGQGLLTLGSPAPESVWSMVHLGFSTLTYDPVQHTLDLAIVCGPTHPQEEASCTPGSTVYSQRFSRAA